MPEISLSHFSMLSFAVLMSFSNYTGFIDEGEGDLFSKFLGY